MKSEYVDVIVDSILKNKEIVSAAITGSHAKNTADIFSDLDMLIISNNVEASKNIATWFPLGLKIRFFDFHLSHYCSIVFEDFQHMDMALFGSQEPIEHWVVNNYHQIKGDHRFQEQLVQAQKDTQKRRSFHHNTDVTIKNIILLLLSAQKRVFRGETISSHTFLSMACDMVISMGLVNQRSHPLYDVLDPRRHLEIIDRDLARIIQATLFTTPDVGIQHIVQYLLSKKERYHQEEIEVLEYLKNMN